MTTLRHSPLAAQHRRLGAKLVPFGGWEMPLAYPAGTLREHGACRSDAVVFDVSHLGTVEVSGPGAFGLLQTALTNDLRKIRPGRAQYTHLLDEADASILDDIIVWWLSDDVFHVMPNASNTGRVLEALGAGAGTDDFRAEDVTEQRALLAVQGPAARRRLTQVAPEAAAVERFGVVEFAWEGHQLLAAGTGYTGEDGIECSVPAPLAPAFWQAVIDVGAVPAGLGARDTLRLEAGLPLHGHELGPGITPLQAGLAWVVGWEKGDFRGREALEAERRRGPERRIRGIVVASRQPPREGYSVSIDGKPVGTVTSGNFSPVLGTGIAMAFLPPDAGPGTAVEVDLRGRQVPGQVVKLPFVTRQAS